MAHIIFLINALLSLLKTTSIIQFKIEVSANKDATITTLPIWYALTDDISIKHHVNADTINNFLSHKLYSSFKSFILILLNI